MIDPIAAGVVISALGIVAWSVLRTRRWKDRAEAAERSATEAQELKNDFVAMVTHELRTPLTSIHGFAETLLESWQELTAAEIQEFLTIVTKQSSYLGDLVEDVLVIPRLEAGRLRFYPEYIDLEAVVSQTANMLFPSGTRRHAAVTIPAGLQVWADPRRVQQVVRNLLENARKYGGDQILIDGFSMGSQYVIIISDNGPGIPDESMRTIFENFEQLSKGGGRTASGLGLGLPIARRLARAMGGEVWLERRFPTGSRFCFSVSARQPLEVGEEPEITLDVEAHQPAGIARV